MERIKTNSITLVLDRNTQQNKASKLKGINKNSRNKQYSSANYIFKINRVLVIENNQINVESISNNSTILDNDFIEVIKMVLCKYSHF